MANESWDQSGAANAHAHAHKHGGADEIATATPAVNAIPKALGTGLLASGWLPGLPPLPHDILTLHTGFPGGTSNFLRADGTWTAAGGGSDPPTGLYAPGSFTVATGRWARMAKRLELTGAQRTTLQGTARLGVSNG